MAMKGYSAYWNLTIRLFSVIFRALVGGRGSYSSAEVQSVYSTAPADWVILCVRGVAVCIILDLDTLPKLHLHCQIRLQDQWVKDTYA